MNTKQKHLLSIIFVIISVGIASSLSLIGGIGIELVSEKLLPIVPLVIVLPALNSLVGDYATLIAAHAGDPSERDRSRSDLVKAMLPSLLVNCLFIIGAGLFLSERRGYGLHLAFVITFVAFIVLSIIAVVSAMFFLTYILDKILVNHHLNPDDVLIPIITTISDILMLGLIALSAVYLF
jgi:cation transporter-like permease